MSSSDDIVLSVRNVSKCFEIYEKPVHRLYQTLCAGKKKFYKEFWALKDVSFDVHRGECVGIIGRNGAGKSTLLQIITGTLAPTGGEVNLKGRVAALLELGSGFNPEFTGRENVYMNGAILGLSRREIDERFNDIVAFADIGEFIDQPVKTYSSGMMVRLAFAVQVMVEPDVLIVDEALAVGDAHFQRKCYARMDALVARGTTILLVTHDIETVKQRCSRVVYINNGMACVFSDVKVGVLAYMKDLFPTEYGESGIEVSKQSPGDGGTGDVAPSDYVLRKRDLACGQGTWGVGGGAVSEIRLIGLAAPNILKTPARLRLEIDVKWNAEALGRIISTEGYRPNVLVGVRFSDVKHVVLFETNNAIENVQINPYAGTCATIAYEIEFPQLRQGLLFVTIALAVGDMTAMKQLFWEDTDIAIQVEAEKVVTGMVGLPVKVDVKGG